MSAAALPWLAAAGAASSNGSLLSSTDSAVLAASVDLSVVWLLLAGFVLACLLLSALGGVKWRRHKRWEELSRSQRSSEASDAAAAADADGAQPSTASEQLSAFSRQLHSQHASTVSLLAEQQSSVRSQLDRLCAEAEQLKALLAARLSGDRGFVDAAIALLLSDTTAAESYRRRQAKREDDVLRAHHDSLARLDEAMHALAAQHSGEATAASTTGQSSLSRVKESAESLLRLASTAQREADKERARVRHSSASSSSILGAEAVSILTRLADEEADAERVVGRLLHTSHAAADNFLFACLEHDMEANASSAAASKRGSGSSSVRNHRLQLTCRRLQSAVARSVAAWPAAAATIEQCRQARSDNETEALQCLQTQKQQADCQANKGLFAGLDQQLVDSITALIRQTVALQRQQYGQLSSGWHSATGPSTATTGAALTAAVSPPLLSALLRSASTDTPAEPDSTAGNPFHSDGSGAWSSPATALSSASLGESFSSWREGEALLSSLVSAESARQLAVCGELDRLAAHSGLSAADESLLRDAAAAVNSLHSTHSAALVRLGERSRAEEQRAVEHRLAALRNRELESERQQQALQADFDAAMASRATAEAETGDSSAGGTVRRLRADFDAAMEQSRSAQQQEALAAETELYTLHQQHRNRLAAANSDMRRQQQQQMADAIKQYERTHGALMDSADEKYHRDLQLEGVDVPSLRAATQSALSTPSARETALAAFHHSNVDELNRRQQSDRRLLEEDAEQRHRDALAAMRAEWEDDTERQRAVDEDEFEQRLRAASDAAAAAVLRNQHADDSKKLDRRRQEVWSVKEASSQQQHKAALDSRRQQMIAEHAAERAVELNDQRDEMFQVRVTVCRQQETALLDQSLHGGTRADGRRVIESAMASRHAAERTRLIAQQEQDNKPHIARLLKADRASLNDRRQQVQRDIDEGQLSESQAAAALAAVDADNSSASTCQRVFVAVAESAAAALSGLQSRQWDEVKAAMLRAFPDESFSGSGWQQQLGTLSPDVASLAEQQAAVMQSAIEASREYVAGLEKEELAAVQRCRDEQRRRMEQLEAKLAREEAAIRAQFEQQLAEAQAEHESKLAQLADDLRRVSEQQPVDERAVADYEAAIDDETQAHTLMMQQAAEQFEAEVAMRSEAQRVHVRAANQVQLSEAITQARSDRQQQEKEARAQHTRLQDDMKDDARRAMRLLERHGRRHRDSTDVGVKQALRAIVSRYTALQPLVQQAQTETIATTTQPREAGGHVTSAADSGAETSGLLVRTAAQWDRIEALLLQMAPGASGPLAAQPDQLLIDSFQPTSHGLTAAIANSSHTGRQLALLESVQRVQAAVCASLAISSLQLRLTDAVTAPSSPTATTTMLPLSHLYTLLPTEHVLLLHDQPHVPPSHHCIAVAFLSAGRHSHFTETTHSPTYQTALVVALTAAIQTVDQRTSATNSMRRTQHHEAAVSARQHISVKSDTADHDVLDELNERLSVLLAECTTGVVQMSAKGDSRVQLYAVLAAIEGIAESAKS